MTPFINTTKKFLQSEVDLYLLEDWGHWIVFCFSLLVSSILVFSSLNFGGICLLFVLSFSSINLLSILVHELGHVIAAQALGLKVWKISLGDGLLLFDKRVLGIRLIIRGTPRTGFVEARIPNISFLRLRLIIFSCGGALGNLCLFFAVLKYYQHFSNFLFVFLVTAFMTANILVWNLVPNRVWMSEGIVENDGLQIIQTIFKSKHELIEEKLASQIRYASEQAKYEQQKINQTQKRRDGSQKSRNTLLFWELLFEDIDFHDYLDYCQRVLERKDISIDQRNETLDTFVTIVLLQGANEYLEAADQYSQEALNNLPHEWTVKGSRGAVLVETGQFQEGIELLMEVMDHEQAPSTRIITASYLALAYSQLGQLQNAQEWLEIGRKIDPDCKLFNRAETVLNQAAIGKP